MQKTLLHGSPSRLKLIEPRWQVAPDGRGAEFVFAQPRQDIAHAYALKTAAVVRVGVNGNSCYIVVTPEEGQSWRRGLARCNGRIGGYIYEVPQRGFRQVITPANDLEWVSMRPKTPLSRRFVSIEDAMRQGVHIFCITDVQRFSYHSSGWDYHGARPFIYKGVDLLPVVTPV